MSKWFKTWFPAKAKTEEQIYAERKAEFIDGLDTRQHCFHEDLKGASQTEVILLLEARIHALETELKYGKSRYVEHIDIPVLTEEVKPPRKPRTPKVVHIAEKNVYEPEDKLYVKPGARLRKGPKQGK